MRYHVIADLVRDRLSLGRGAEIGVWKGETTQHLLHTLPALTDLLAVDPFQYYERFDDSGSDHKREFKKYPTMQAGFDALYERNVARLDKAYPGRVTWMRMMSTDAAEHVEDGSLDFVFVDGCHCYEYVSADVRLWTPKLRKGGILIGHDWGTIAGYDKDIKHPVQAAVMENYGDKYTLESFGIWWVLPEDFCGD
jgi:hypothetical protein